GFGLLLRAAEARGGDHLHRRGDFLGRADAADTVPQILQAGHRLRRRIYAKVRANSSREAASPFSVSSGISPRVRIASSNSGRLLRSSPSSCFSKRVTSATSTRSR